MTERSWKALLTVKGTVLNIEICEDAGSIAGGEVGLRRCSSEPVLHTLAHPIICTKQAQITVDPCSEYFAEVFPENACLKDKDSDVSDNASTLDTWTPYASEESEDTPVSSLALQDVEIKDFDCSMQLEDWEDDAEYGDFVAYGSERWAAKNKRRRPCKGQRIRHRKLEARLMSEIDQRPEGFDLDSMSLPPSLEKDGSRKQTLFGKLQAYRQRVLREREIATLLKPLAQEAYQPDYGNLAFAEESLFSKEFFVAPQTPMSSSPSMSSSFGNFCGHQGQFYAAR